MKISLFINLVPTQIRFLLWLEKYNTINKILMEYENDLIKGTLKLGYYKEGGLHSRVFNRLRKLHLPEYNKKSK